MQVKENFEVKNLTSFKCGGKIKKVIFPENLEEFIEVLNLEKDAEVFGNLSNTLVSSDGYDGTVILTTKMDKFSIKGNIVTAECGLKGPKLAQAAAEKGLSGLEFMVAFPGSIGGEVFMNAGAHGQSISDCIIEAQCFSRKNGVIVLKKSDLDFSYRNSLCQKENLIVLNAVFELTQSSKSEVIALMDKNLSFRKTHQPSLTLPNCGSVFRNPEGDSAGRLLDEIGAKSFNQEGVRVWENHANFIINDGGFSEDILKLMLKMQNAVKEKFNIELKPEVRFLGGNIREVELCRNLKIK